MNLHESADVFRELIQATATDRGIPAIYVEKDYWVTRVLKRLSESEYRESFVFKGGTSLSKAYGLIERFSEDIDLAIRDSQALSNARRRRLMKAIEGVASQDLTYLEAHPLESKHGRFRKTAYAFPTHSDVAELGQVADTLLIELNSFANPEPASTMPIATLIHDFLAAMADPVGLIRRHELESFQIPVLRVERTLCEKIMGLVRAGHEANALAEFKRRIRHFYDIVMILREREYREFLDRDAFASMIAEVCEWDRKSMPGASAWLDPPLAEAMIATDAENLWRELRTEFRGTFQDMLYGDSVPDDDEVLASLTLIGASLASI